MTANSSLPMRALVRAAWQESFNSSWRFSPAKRGLWMTLVQVGMAALVIWRLSGQPAVADVSPVLLFGALQSLLFAFISLFLRGRTKLYAGPVVQLIHLSPTPAWAAIAAEVLSVLPGRLWSALVFTAALFPAMPAGSRLWATPALWLLILLGGLLGHLTGLLVLMAWVRFAPRSLGGIWVASMVATLALFYYIAYLLVGGVSAAEVADGLQRAGGWLPIGMGLFFGLPGLAMCLRLLRSPRAAGELYREGWLALMELGDASSRPRRSRFPRIAPGPVGAVQSLVWLMSLRNWMSSLRLGLWAACLAGITLAGPTLSGLPAERRLLFVLGLGLATALLNYGEQAAALFSADGPRIALAAMAGIRPHQLMAGKWLAALPLPLVAAISTVVTGLAARQPFGYALGLSGVALLIALCCLTWLVGAAAFDAPPKENDLAAESEQLAAAFEQSPSRFGGVAGLAGAIGLAAAGVWLYTVHPAWLAALPLLPLLALGAGHARLRSLLRNGFESR